MGTTDGAFDENVSKHIEKKQKSLMRCLFERVAQGEQLELTSKYPWKKIRSELLRQAVSWVYGRHALYDLFSSEDVAERIGSYLFFPHKNILDFLAREAEVPPCADYCYIKEAIEEGTYFKKCISCGSEDVDDRWVPTCSAFCGNCEQRWMAENVISCNGDCDHVNPWRCEDCDCDDVGCYVCDHRDDSIALFEFYQGMQTLSRKEMCQRFELKMRCEDCRKMHSCWEGKTKPCDCYCHSC